MNIETCRVKKKALKQTKCLKRKTSSTVDAWYIRGTYRLS